MLLSSIRRLRAHVNGMQMAPLTASNNNDRLLKQWLTTVSLMIEKFLDREIELKSRTEYFDITAGKKRYHIKAFPVTTLTSVYTDSTGLWDGSSEDSLDDCFADAHSVILPYAFEYDLQKALRVIYTGGLAAHAVNSTFILAVAQTGTWAAGSYVAGASSGAVGVVVSYTAGTRALVVENYYGSFTSGEALTQTTDENTGSSTATGTISSVSSPALVDAAPEIVSACEAQVRWMWRHTTDFENSSSNKDGTTTRSPLTTEHQWPLTNEVRDMLTPYRRIVVG